MDVSDARKLKQLEEERHCLIISIEVLGLMTPPHPAHIDMKMIGMIGVVIGA
jgi:hypothetical protein